MVKHVLRFLALAVALPGYVGVAKAAPNFKGMQFMIVCPEFDVDKKPDKDDQPLYDLSRRVYQGTLIGEKDGCEHLKKGEGKEGWLLAHVVWSSDQNPNLYSEDTAIYIGEHGDDGPGISLFLDGNGDPKQFAAMYTDLKTNIMNEPGLAISVEIANPDYYLLHPNEKPDKDDYNQYNLVNQQKLKPTPWALWSLHSGDSAQLERELQQEIHDRQASDTATLQAANAYTDSLHAHIHTEIAAEAAARVAGDAMTLAAAEQYTQQQVAAEAQARQNSDATLQAEIDTKVGSVTATAPITSTGGTNPVIGLAPCADGQVYKMVGGQWKCGPAGGAVDHNSAIYSRNHRECGQEMNVLTLASGCSFDPGCSNNNPPSCPSGCSFSQTSVTNVCTKTCVSCDWTCTTYCCQFTQQFCGSCSCQNQFVGFTTN